MTQTVRIALSTKGLKDADRISRNDFRFVSGSDVFVCDRLQAAFLSPQIANLLTTDPTFDEFSLNRSDSRSFQILRELLIGCSLIVDENNIDIFECLIEDLGNSEISEIILEFTENDESLNVSNCISRLKKRLKHCVGIARECDFIASHFSEFELEVIQSLEFNILKDILQSNSLRILNEDWLLQFIFGIGSSYSELIGSIRFEYLSCSSIDLFFEHTNIEDVTDEIWHQLWIRSRHQPVYDMKIFPTNRFTSFVNRSPDSPWSSGLIYHLCQMFGGNIHEKGIIEITCSSTGYNKCWQIVNYDWNNYFHTNNSPNNWIQFDFKDRVVSLTDYALKSDGNLGCHLVEWQVAGSMDCNEWTILDHQKTQDLNGKYRTKIFHLNDSSSSSPFYRYIRLTQTGKNSSNGDYLCLSNIEFFGWMTTSIVNSVNSKA
jgi:hypothetical protein